MFKIAQLPAYWAPVEVPLVLESGKTEIRKFEAKFKRLTQSELADVRERGEAQTLRDRDLLHEILLDWKGVAEEDGTEIPFSAVALDRLLEIYPVQPSLVKAFFKSMGGARTGN